MSKTKRSLLYDILLVVFFLTMALVFYLITSFGSDDATVAVVRVNGIETAVFSMLENGTYVLNNGTNILEIKDGYAQMHEAHCPDKLCVKQGKIKKSGQCITCLPNKLTVTLEGGKTQVDFVL